MSQNQGYLASCHVYVEGYLGGFGKYCFKQDGSIFFILLWFYSRLVLVVSLNLIGLRDSVKGLTGLFLQWSNHFGLLATPSMVPLDQLFRFFSFKLQL